jgi:hypothetical protein
MKNLIFALIAPFFLIGCQCQPGTPGDLPPPEGDLVHLLTANPAAVTDAELLATVEAAESRIAMNNVVEGIYWQAVRTTPTSTDTDGFGLGGDSLLFTGKYLASCAYKYGVTKSSTDLDNAIEALRGIYILTHASGTPGALMRCAFPSDDPDPWGYPASWGYRATKGFVYDSPTDLDDPFNPGDKLPQMTFYTSVTRDQVTGLVYGLSVFWSVVKVDSDTDPADHARIQKSREILAGIVNDVYGFLRLNDFKIRDQTGRNDTNSDHVGKDLLRLALLSLYRHTVDAAADPNYAARIQDKYEELLNIIKTLGFFPADPFNSASNATQYYAWNLRLTRASTLWLNVDEADKETVSKYIYKWMYRFVKGHKNAWFTYVYAATTVPLDNALIDLGTLCIKSWSLRDVTGWPSPLAKGWGRDYCEPNPVEKITGAGDSKALWPHLRKPTLYWTWQKAPWDAGVTYPLPVGAGVGLDLLLPYWMGRYHGLVD